MTAAAAARPYQGERRRRAVVISVTHSGTAHTQWCVQENGEISRPVMAQQVAAASWWPRRYAEAATAIPVRPVTSARASQQVCAGCAVLASRATAPARDWSEGLAGLPILS